MYFSKFELLTEYPPGSKSLVKPFNLGSYNFRFQQSWQKLRVSVVICHGRAENPGFLPVYRPCLARWWVSHSEHWQLNAGQTLSYQRDSWRTGWRKLEAAASNWEGSMVTVQLSRRRKWWLIFEQGEAWILMFQENELSPTARHVSVLFCTEVAAMGVNCSDLCLGVSLGTNCAPFDLPLEIC